MSKHDECSRRFIQLSKAWYADANLARTDIIDQVTIGYYHPEGGTTGEFQVTWKELGGKVVPSLHAFDDGWSALFQFGDMLESMADIDDKNVSPDEFCKLLVAIGIEDDTPTEHT